MLKTKRFGDKVVWGKTLLGNDFWVQSHLATTPIGYTILNGAYLDVPQQKYKTIF